MFFSGMPEDFIGALEPYKPEGDASKPEGDASKPEGGAPTDAAPPAEGGAGAGTGTGTGAAEGDGKLTITLSYPHVLPLLRKCSVEATRQKVRGFDVPAPLSVCHPESSSHTQCTRRPLFGKRWGWEVARGGGCLCTCLPQL